MERKWWTLIAVGIGVFMLLLDLTIVNVALPTIQRSFHATLSDLQWVVDAYALTLAALLLTGGSLADLFGRRRLFAIGIAIFTLGSLLCGLSSDATFLSLARAGQGIGGAIMFATSLALLSNAFHGADRGTAFGVFGAITGISVAVGPVLGGVITSGISWRWIFFVNVPLGVIALVITLREVAESREPHAHGPDWFGFITFSGALASLVYGLIRANTLGWGATTVIACFAGFVVLMVAFIAIELVQRHPMLDLTLLRKPTFVGGLTSAFAINGSMFALLTYLVLFQQNILGYSALYTGLHFLTFTGALFVMSAIAGRLSHKVPTRLLIGPGFLFLGAGLLAMRGNTVTTGWTHLIPGFILAGIGAGLVNVPLASTAVGVVDRARAGMASGVNSTLRQVGTATGVALYGSLLATQLRSVVVGDLARTPLASHAHQVAASISSGDGAAAASAGVSPSLHAVVVRTAHAGFVSGLNEVLLCGAVLAFLGAVCAFVLIRQRDFVQMGEPAPSEGYEVAPGVEAVTAG